MVTFAPQIPERGDPEYLRYSKEIRQPEGDKSGYYLMKGLGDTIQEGASNLDKTITQYAKDKSFEEFQELENKHKEDLKPTWEYYKSLENPNENTTTEAEPMGFSGDPVGSPIQNNKDLPPEIRFGTKQAQANTERFNNGKMSQTQYDMEIDTLAKNLNSRFPAYHDAIQQGMSKATGRANANQTVTDMISDINRITGQLNAQKNKIDSHAISILKDLDPGSAAEMIKRRFGTSPGQPGYMTDPEVLKHLYNGQAGDVARSRLKANLELEEAGNRLTKENAQQNLNEMIAHTADTYMNRMTISGKDWPENILAAQRLRDNPNDPEGLKVINDMRRLAEGMEADMRKSAVPYSRKLGGSVNTTINDQMAYFKGLINDMGDPQKAGNAVAASKAWVDAQMRDATAGFVKSDVGRQAIMYNAMNDLTKANPELKARIDSQFSAITKDAGPKIGKVFSDWAQQGVSIKPGDPNNKQATVEQGIEEARKLGASPQTLQGYINFIGNIKDLPDAQARSLAYAYFSPNNLGLVSKWAREGFNPRSEGQTTVLQKLGSKVVSDRIYNLGDPTLIGHYKSFMENAFAHTVFPTLMVDTREMSIAAGDRLRYNTDTAHFEITPISKSTDISDPYTGRNSTSDFLNNTVKRLNASIDTMKNIAIHERKDPNEYLIGLIREGDPNAFSREVPGFPGQVNDAIRNQVKQKDLEKAHEAFVKKNYEEAK